jgi:lysophospholipase L1-like esterase
MNGKFLSLNSIVMLVSATLALLLAEGLVRLAYRGSVDFDMEMWKYATQIKVPSDDPEVVHEHRPNAHALLMGVEVQTNALGLRDIQRSLRKPKGTYRIVALGDSITMGWGVAQDKTYAAQLEQMLNARTPRGFPPGQRFEVLNLGVGNYNTVQEIARLRHLGLQFEPDLITLGYFINDAEPTPKPSRGFLIENSYLSALVVSRKNILWPPTASYAEYYRGLFAEDQPGWKASQEALGGLAAISRETRTPAMMFIIPELHDLGEGYPFLEIHERLVIVARAKQLPVVDLYPQFKNYKPEIKLWVTPRDAHHNAEAQGMIAKGMYAAIEARELVQKVRAR